MLDYTVSEATDAHLDGIAEIENLCFCEPWSRESVERLLHEMGLAVVATLPSQEVIGYVGLVLAADEGQITNLAVHPSYRRCGVGGALLDALLREAERRSLYQVSLEVRASNTVARDLYLSRGFSVAGTRRGFYRKPIEDALVMLWSPTE